MRIILMIHPQVHLRIPCYDFSFLQIIRFKCFLHKTQVSRIHHFHRIIQSVGATGGVYKGQGRNQRKLMTCAYQEFLVQDQQFQWSIPSLMNIQKIPHFFRKRNNTRNPCNYSLRSSLQRACGPEHRRASQTCYCLKLPSISYIKHKQSF